MSDPDPPTAREHSVTREPRPETDLRGFPAREVDSGSSWFRAHRAVHGPWWFSSGGGRFDLSPPHGTCYLAATEATAAREVIGPSFVWSGRVPSSLVAGRVVSRLVVDEGLRCALLTSSRTAAFGAVGAELSAAVTYRVSGAWAYALFSAGFGGVWYSPRFSGPDSRALALFGEAGEAARPRDPSARPLAAVVAEVPDVHVLPVPERLGELRVLDEPR